MTDDEVIERCVQDQVRANQDAIDEASALALRRGLCGVRWWPNPNGTVTAEVHLSVPYMEIHQYPSEPKEQP